uniref:7TM_GPCR_Srx domain-containing protein n=1 Tax=Heterorhabditis bacteriophora TaxID=37862 RepID=A0A1I7WQF2_HETBA
MEDPQWYHRPLDLEDMIAGGSMLTIGTLTISLYAIVMRIMWKQDKDIVGYRFLISTGVTDMLLLINYGIWPGLTILTKSEIITPNMRHWLQIYLDWAWFSMVWHYSVVGWSRWYAIRSPHEFRNQKRWISYLICSCCYILSMIQYL